MKHIKHVTLVQLELSLSMCVIKNNGNVVDAINMEMVFSSGTSHESIKDEISKVLSTFSVESMEAGNIKPHYAEVASRMLSSFENACLHAIDTAPEDDIQGTLFNYTSPLEPHLHGSGKMSAWRR